MNKLLEVLGNLDPTKDEHWTQDGVARLDVVSELMGSQVTRAQIQEAAPKFSRANPNVVTIKQDPFADAGEEDKPEMLGTGSASVEGAGEPEVKAPQENHAGPVELTAEQEIETEYKNAKTALEAAQRRMQRATDRMDDLIRARESNQQNVTFTDNVQAYLKSQREELHRDHIAKERLKTLMKGLENDL